MKQFEQHIEANLQYTKHVSIMCLEVNIFIFDLKTSFLI